MRVRLSARSFALWVGVVGAAGCGAAAPPGGASSTSSSSALPTAVRPELPRRDPAGLTAAVSEVATGADFHGVLLVARGAERLLLRGFGTVEPGGDTAFTPASRWRWASITKQITAAMILQEVDAGHLALDTSVAAYLPSFASANAAKLTVRQLLRHQSGLPNPDATPAGADGVPAFYSASSPSVEPLTGVCAGPPLGEPGGAWSYNNCDYLVAGRVLEQVTGMTWSQLITTRLRGKLDMTTVGVVPFDQTVPGFVGGQPEGAYALERFGAAAALSGSIEDLWRFDRALLDGALLSPAARAQLWDGVAELGFIALGQWVFPASLRGCAEATTVVERRGGIGGVQTRNYLLPEHDLVVIAFTNRGELDFGEIWTSAGLGYELLSAAACPPAASAASASAASAASGATP